MAIRPPRRRVVRIPRRPDAIQVGQRTGPTSPRESKSLPRFVDPPYALAGRLSTIRLEDSVVDRMRPPEAILSYRSHRRRRGTSWRVLGIPVSGACWMSLVLMLLASSARVYLLLSWLTALSVATTVFLCVVAYRLPDEVRPGRIAAWAGIAIWACASVFCAYGVERHSRPDARTSVRQMVCDTSAGVLTEALIRYRADHRGRFPSFKQINEGQVLLRPTDADGNVDVSGGCGPYLHSMPTNPFTGNAVVVPKQHDDVRAGWVFDEATGNIKAVGRKPEDGAGIE
jgi:hypothetical protein